MRCQSKELFVQLVKNTSFDVNTKTKASFTSFNEIAFDFQPITDILRLHRVDVLKKIASFTRNFLSSLHERCTPKCDSKKILATLTARVLSQKELSVNIITSLVHVPCCVFICEIQLFYVITEKQSNQLFCLPPFTRVHLTFILGTLTSGSRQGVQKRLGIIVITGCHMHSR